MLVYEARLTLANETALRLGSPSHGLCTRTARPCSLTMYV